MSGLAGKLDEREDRGQIEFTGFSRAFKSLIQ